MHACVRCHVARTDGCSSILLGVTFHVCNLMKLPWRRSLYMASGGFVHMEQAVTDSDHEVTVQYVNAGRLARRTRVLAAYATGGS